MDVSQEAELNRVEINQQSSLSIEGQVVLFLEME